MCCKKPTECFVVNCLTIHQMHYLQAVMVQFCVLFHCISVLLGASIRKIVNLFWFSLQILQSEKLCERTTWFQHGKGLRQQIFYFFFFFPQQGLSFFSNKKNAI